MRQTSTVIIILIDTWPEKAKSHSHSQAKIQLFLLCTVIGRVIYYRHQICTRNREFSQHRTVLGMQQLQELLNCFSTLFLSIIGLKKYTFSARSLQLKCSAILEKKTNPEQAYKKMALIFFLLAMQMQLMNIHTLNFTIHKELSAQRK